MNGAKRGQNGFSALELAMVCALIGVITAAAYPLFQSITRISNADGAAQLIAQELNMARAMAVSTNGPVLVQLNPNDRSITVAPGTGSARGPFVLPGRMRFMTSAQNPDTPDTVGGTLLGPSPNTLITFLDNGTAATDASGATLCTGTFFLQDQNGDATTIRGVTLLGGTGRAHVWIFDPTKNSWN